MKRRSSHFGQAGLIVMLVMVVLLTLGISIASRTTLDVSQSTQEAETSRVFDVAEAGIERALYAEGVSLEAGSGDYEVGGLSGSYTIAAIDSLEVALDESQVVGINTGEDEDTGIDYAGNVKIEWSKVGDCGDNPASIVVSILNSTVGTIRRYAYEGCDNSDGFLTPVGAAPTSPYQFATTISVDADEDLVRVRPVYNETWLRVTGDANFPTQYFQISSEASNDVSGETRAIQVDRTIPTAPTIFDYVLFSGTTISK